MFLPFIRVWILTIASVYGNYARNKMAADEQKDIDDFFDQIEKVMNTLPDDSKSKGINSMDPRKQRYIQAEDTARQTNYDQLQTKLADDLRRQHVDGDNDVYNSVEADRKGGALNFEGFQEFPFRPLYPCDRFDAARRYCVFFGQLGTTLTLGVEIGEGTRRGVRLYWYRYLKKKLNFIKEPLNRGVSIKFLTLGVEIGEGTRRGVRLHWYRYLKKKLNFIKEHLNKDFLPWNLNLGGSETELRISPVTEMDLSYNYFEVELDRSDHEKYGRKPTLRFRIEPINIDMGTLYHGEEIIIYARAFMEVPRTSVNFLWSMYEMNDFEDRGLPSNMRLNSEKSSVIIKELKTYQSHILSCSVYSNKNVLLAKRNFLFKGFGNEQTNEKSNHTRHRRDTEETEFLYDDPDFMAFPERDTKQKATRKPDVPSGNQDVFQQVNVPKVPEDLFYDDRKSDRPYFEDWREPQSRPLRSDMLPFFPNQHSISDSSRRQREMHGHDSVDPTSIEEDVLVKQNQPEETLRFEDKESLSIATCSTNSDCNIYATCTRSSFSGQNFCKCWHGYNGNGIFCFNS